MLKRFENKFAIKLVLALTLFITVGFLTKGISAFAATAPAEPKASVKSGSYFVTDYKTVKLSCTTKNAVIFYSTDGENYSKYSGGIKLRSNTTLYTYSSLDGVKSSVKTYSYKLKVKLGSIAPDAGTYDGEQIVKITTDAEKVNIYYTLNGKKPTAKSAKYTASGIKITESCTLRILVKKSGFTNRYLTKKYVINKTNEADSSGNGHSDVKQPDDSSLKNSLADVSKVTALQFKEGYDIYGKRFSDRVYYPMLNESQQKMYELLYRGAVSLKESIDVSQAKCSYDDMGTAYYFMICESPELFWVHDGYYSTLGSNPVKSVKLKYTNSSSEVDSRFQKIEKKADSIVEAALAKDTLFDRVLYFYDWIIDNTEYTYGSGQSRDVAGTDDVLLDGHGLCTAYSRAFMYLCHKSGIDCVMVNGNADNGYGYSGHSWNKICLDCKWYVIDVTWDDPVFEAGYSSDSSNHSYSYFCITDKEINENHIADDIFDIKSLKCTSTDYSYRVQKNIELFDNVEDAYRYLSDNAMANYIKGQSRTEIFLASEELANALFEYIQNGHRIPISCGYSYGPSGRMFFVNIF